MITWKCKIFQHPVLHKSFSYTEFITNIKRARVYVNWSLKETQKTVESVISVMLWVTLAEGVILVGLISALLKSLMRYEYNFRLLKKIIYLIVRLLCPFVARKLSLHNVHPSDQGQNDASHKIQRNSVEKLYFLQLRLRNFKERS